MDNGFHNQLFYKAVIKEVLNIIRIVIYFLEFEQLFPSSTV